MFWSRGEGMGFGIGQVALLLGLLGDTWHDGPVSSSVEWRQQPCAVHLLGALEGMGCVVLINAER